MSSEPTPEIPERGTVTRLLAQVSAGRSEAMDDLLPLVYEELKELGRSQLRREPEGHTLNATALVHEAYLKLVDQQETAWKGRGHFFAVASLCMRRILLQHARDRLRQKRGGGAPHLPLEEAPNLAADDLLTADEATELVALDGALTELETFNPRGAEVVQYRFFGGLANREIAEVTGVSEVTVRRRWNAARAWLRSQLGGVDQSASLLVPNRA